MEIDGNYITLAEMAYQLAIIRICGVSGMIEQSDACAYHKKRTASKRCRFCDSLMCDIECASVHENVCPSALLVPVCYRSKFNLGIFSSALYDKFGIDVNNPFGSPEKFQEAVKSVDKILSSMQ